MADTTVDPAAAPAVSVAAESSVYPGPFEWLHRECKEMFASSHLVDGFRFICGLQLTDYFASSHQVHLTQNGSSYTFVPTYANPPHTAEPDVMLSGNVDSSGNTNATALVQVMNNVRSKLNLQVQRGKGWGYAADVDVKGSDWHLALKTVNGSLADSNGTFITNYLQSVTPNLAIGAELIAQVDGGARQADILVSGRYRTPQSVSTLSAGPTGSLSITHVQKVERGQFGAELECELSKMASLATVGYQFAFRTGMVRGQFDTSGVIAATFDQNFAYLPLSFSLTGMHDFGKDSSKFGIGLAFGQ